MENILVSGPVSLETTVKIPSFPLNYAPICQSNFGIETTVAGEGVNLARMLTSLGNGVRLVSLIGGDKNGKYALDVLKTCGIEINFIQPMLKSTPQTVVMVDENQKREFLCDWKDLQDVSCGKKVFLQALDECKIAALCNVNFSRPYLKAVRDEGKLIATNVHTVSDVHDAYNEDFMKSADILFLNSEKLPGTAEDFVKELSDTYRSSIIVVRLGTEESFLYVRSDNYTGKIGTPLPNNVAAADDILFASFLHNYAKTGNPYESLEKVALLEPGKTADLAHNSLV